MMFTFCNVPTFVLLKITKIKQPKMIGLLRYNQLKQEILDIRTYLTIVLVLISLCGHHMVTHKNINKSDTQNLNFIKP
jgi:hypothetical protein